MQMKLHSDDQLEIQFGEDAIDDVVARGFWEDAMSRSGFLRALGAGALGAAAVASTAQAKGLKRGAAPGAGQTIAVALNGFNEYDQCAGTGVVKALQGTRYKLIVRQANFDPKQELPNIEDLVVQRPDGISIQPSTVQGSCRGAQKAKAGGVKMIQNQFWFKPTPCDNVFMSVLAWDNFGGGRMIGQHIKKVVPDGGKILHVTGIPGQGFSETLAAGLKAELGGKWPIVATQPAFYDRAKAINVTQTMLTGNPDAKIVVSDATEMGVGVASFLERTGKKDIVNITSDSNHELVKYLRNGYISAVRYVSPAQGGFLSVMAIRQFLETGKKPQHKMPQPHQMITKADLSANSNSYLINPNLKPASGYICYDPLLKIVRKW